MTSAGVSAVEPPAAAPERVPSVDPVTRRLNYVSPSQVKTFQQCSRKWWFEKLEGLRSPESGGQRKGKELHRQLEDYLRTGRAPEHKSARLAVEFLPAPSPQLLVEQAMGEESIRYAPADRKFTDAERADAGPSLYLRGVPLIGFIDLLIPGGVPIVHDHKGTADKKWAKTPDDLANDFQMLSYGVYTAERYPDVRDVELTHGYLIHTGKARAWPISSHVGVDVIRERWHKQGDATVAAMQEVAKAGSHLDVEVVPEEKPACKAFGGCPFRSRCFPPKELVIVDLTAMLKKPAAPAPAPATPAVAADMTPSPVAATPTPSIMPPDAPPAVLSTTAPGAQPLLVEQEAPKAKRPPKKAEAAPAPATETGGFTLYIGCRPVKTEAHDLGQYVALVAAALAQEHSVNDIRYAPGNQALAYAQWKGALAAACRRNPPPAGAYFAAGDGDLLSVALEALCPLAAEVVR